MSVWEAVFLGLLQGLTEFLPVSSSGHLVLFQGLFGLSSGAARFGIVAHLGTLLSVCVYLRRDLTALLRRPFSAETGLLFLATAPAVAAALLFDGFVRASFGGAYLGFGFLVTAFALFVTSGRAAASDKAGGGAGLKAAPGRVLSPRGNGAGLKTALYMGAAQAVAILPGVSRSGLTVSGGILSGADRPSAARFSFLMSIPIIAAAAVAEFAGAGGEAAGVPAGALAAGFVASALSGYVAVRFMSGVIARSRLRPFSYYLLGLGAFVLLNRYVFKFF